MSGKLYWNLIASALGEFLGSVFEGNLYKDFGIHTLTASFTLMGASGLFY